MIALDENGEIIEVSPDRSFDLLASKRYLKTHFPPQRPVRPSVVVTGHQKSGTSVVAAAVGAALDLPVSMDATTDIFWPAGWSHKSGLKRKAYLNVERLASRGVVKEPNLIFQLDRVFREIRPTHGVIAVRRDPVEVIESILARLDLDAAVEVLTVQDFRALPLAWQNIFCGVGVSDTTGMSLLDSIAARVASAEQVVRGFEGPVIEYSEFLEEPVAEVGLALRSLGLISRPFDDDAELRIERVLSVRHQPSRARSKSNFSLSVEQAASIHQLLEGV